MCLAIFFLVSYTLRTPQPLKSDMSGEDRLFHWTHGHVFYKVAGAQDAPPLVLIHAPELAASSYEMRGLIEPLAQRYRVYALDLPGFGLSDHPHIAYTGDLYIAFLRDFLRQVVARPATLVTSGLSANYAIALASATSTTPARVERLVLLSPTALFTIGKQQHWYTPLLHNAFIGLCLYAFLTTRIVLRAVLTQSVSRTEISTADLDHYFASAHQFGAEHSVLAAMAGDLSLDVSRQLETMQQPVLVLWGFHALQRTLHSSQTVAELRDGASSPLLAFPDTSGAADTHNTVMLLQDEGAHIREAQSEQVASFILQWIDTKRETPVETQEEHVVAHDYTEKDEGIEAYCVKCKQKRIISDPQDTVTKNGRSAKEGTCPVCGTHLFRFVAS